MVHRLMIQFWQVYTWQHICLNAFTHTLLTIRLKRNNTKQTEQNRREKLILNYSVQKQNLHSSKYVHIPTRTLIHHHTLTTYTPTHTHVQKQVYIHKYMHIYNHSFNPTFLENKSVQYYWLRDDHLLYVLLMMMLFMMLIILSRFLCCSRNI